MTPDNWLFFSDGLQFESYEQWANPFEISHPTDRDWKDSLKTLSNPTDKMIIVFDGIESGGYWPLIGIDAEPLLHLIHTYSHPDNKIWFTNTDAYAQRNYDDWCRLVNPKMRINVKPLQPSNCTINFIERYNKFEHHESLKFESKHRVICMVNRPTYSRILTLRELAGFPGFIYSFNCTDLSYVVDGESNDDCFNMHLSMAEEAQWSFSDDGNSIEYLDNSHYVDNNCGVNMSNERFDQSKRVNFKTSFNMEKDTDAYHDFLPVKEWIDSDIDLVCETHQIRQFHLSEKTCKPLGFSKPFLVIGCYGWYKVFKELGFELYDELFDYSFDEIEPFRLRHEAIMSQMKDVLNMDKDVFSQKMLAIQDKVYYNNRQLLKFRKKEMNAFEMAKQIDVQTVT